MDYNKFQKFVEDLIEGVHDFDAHTFKIYLTAATPDASADTVKGDLTEIGGSGGYTSKTTTITTSRSGGVAKAAGTDCTWTAAGGTIGPFRYAPFFNDTPASPLDPLISWWDYGAQISLLNTESFIVDVDATNGLFTAE